MTEVEFKRKLAALFLYHAEQYIDKATCEILKLVTTVEDERAVMWQPYPVCLSNKTMRITVGVTRSLNDTDLFEDFYATFSAYGKVCAETRRESDELLNVATDVVEKAQHLVEQFNASALKQVKKGQGQ